MSDISSVTQISLFSKANPFPYQSVSPRIPGKQQIYRKICEWFESWQPWQQRILLCGATNRCSFNQLESLATTLEPVFHRDFVNTVQKRYPSAPFRNLKRLNRNETAKVINHITHQHLPKTPEKNSRTASRETPRQIRKVREESEQKEEEKEKQKNYNKDVNQTSECLQNFALKFSQSILQDAISLVDISSSEDAVGKLTGSSEKNVSFDVNETSVTSKSPIQKDANEFDSNSSTNTSKSPVCSERKENELMVSRDRKEIKVLNKNRNVVEHSSPEFEAKFSNVPDKVDKYPDGGKLSLLARYFPPTEYTLIPHGQISPSLNDPVCGPDCSSSLSNVVLHRHKSSFRSAEIRTSDFFAKTKIDKLGPLQMQMRTGQVRRPPNLNDVHIPAQRLYKNAKLWRDTPAEGHAYFKPKKTDLKLLFRNQITQIWEWFAVWEDFERLGFLVEVVKSCNEQMISYLTQCLSQRLHERVDINWLSDKQLVALFSYLSPQEIDCCAQVCRRWKYLCSLDVLWIHKCQQIGNEHSIENITRLIQNATKADEGIDWRVAYLEMARILCEMKLSLPEYKDGHIPDKTVGPSGTIGKSDEQEQDNPSKRRESITCATDLFVQRGTVSQIDQIKQAHTQHQSEALDEFSVTNKKEMLKSRMASLRSYASKLASKSTNVGAGSVSLDQSKDSYVSSRQNVSQGTNRSHWRGNKRALHDAEEELALDIRPELIQTRDLLGKSTSHYNLKWRPVKEAQMREKYMKFAGYVKGVKRVRRLQGHMDVVVTVQCDTRRLISGSKDRVIRVWDIRSGTSIHKLYGHKGGVRCLKLFENTLISGSWDMSIMVWDLVKFTRQGFLCGHSGVVTDVDVTADKSAIISASHDRTVRLWCMSTYACQKIIATFTEPIICMVFDGDRIITAMTDKSLHVTDFATSASLHVLSGSPANTLCMVVVNDLIMSGDEAGHVQFWNKHSGDLEASIQAHEEAVYSITFYNGRFFTASADTTIKEWDLITMTCVRSLHGHKEPVHDFKVSEKRFVSCSEDGNIRVWDLFVPLLRLGTRADEDNIPTEIINKREFWGT